MMKSYVISISMAVLVLAASNAVLAAPRGIVNVPVAVSAWNVKPRAGETTAAMEKRVKRGIIELVRGDKAKLDYDVSYWRLLSYLHDLPWPALPAGWKSWYLEKMPNPRLTNEQRDWWLERIERKPIYMMAPKEADVYLGWAQRQFPNLRERVVHLARKNINQPYRMYLLGEFPYEVYDPDPMFSLGKSDCVVFSEHTYAMALSHDWKEFFATLQKIRYKDGKPGMTTRNHYTEADWDKNNAWLVEDVTGKLGATTVTRYQEKIDRAKFFGNFGIGQDFKPEMLDDIYIPAQAVEGVLPKLKDGDFVNVARGQGSGVWMGHVGLIGRLPDGTVTFIHSTSPKVKEQPIMQYVNDNVKKNAERARKGNAQFLGFKFLRLRDEVLK
ncbi:MAG: N-acetylmuramoyl-L-alanine amidase-like domain-containing protein [bacterium]